MASVIPVIAKHYASSSNNKTNIDGTPQDSGTFTDGQFNFAGRDCITIPDKLAESLEQKIIRLDLSCNCIRYIDCLDRFQVLEELILDNNHVNDEAVFPPIPSLHTLTLNKNQIKDLDLLLDKLLVSYPNLTYLSLLGNEACPNELSCKDKDEEDYSRYRFYVIYRLPNLKFLDSTSVKPLERIEANKRGPFLKVIRPTENRDMDSSSDDNHPQFSPLPQDTSQHDPVSFGKCKYVYYGKHSEGNRFIRNNDL